MIVFLDLDGTLCDWTKRVCDVTNFDYKKVMENWKPGVYDTSEQLGISDSWMWTKIDACENFWIDIEPYDYAHRLVKELKKKHEVHICSSPSQRKCMDQKQEWLIKHKFGFGRNFIFTPQKHLLAGPDRVLVDDLDKNIDKFFAHKGLGILIPQKWNSKFGLANRSPFSNFDMVEYVMTELEKLP